MEKLQENEKSKIQFKIIFGGWSRYDRSKKIFDIVILLSVS